MKLYKIAHTIPDLMTRCSGAHGRLVSILERQSIWKLPGFLQYKFQNCGLILIQVIIIDNRLVGR